MPLLPPRERALALMHEYTGNENLRRHMYAVEAAMRGYASKYGEDAELWGLTGLMHDFDYERWPNEAHLPDSGHPSEGVRLLRERGWPEEACRAILAHADYTGVEPETRMERALRAVDELTGFLTACALVRPNGITDLEPKSVRKKLKDRAFAAAVDRDAIARGAEALGVDLTEHIAFVIGAMRGIADRLGLESRAAGGTPA